MDPTTTPESNMENKEEHRSKLNLMRFALLSWWKRRRTFYIHVHQSGSRNLPQLDAAKQRLEGTDDDSSVHCTVPRSPTRSGECSSSSSSSSSYLDVTSISTGRDHINVTKKQPQEGQSRIDGSTGSRRERGKTTLRDRPPNNATTEDEVFLSRPFPFTPRQSVSSQSLQSLDSITGSSSCGELSNGNIDSFVPLDNNSSDSFPILASSLNSTDIIGTDTIHDQEDFFEEHVLFLRNQTQPHRVRELNLMQSKMPNNIDPY